MRYLSCQLTLADGQKQSWVTLTRAGEFSDPRYGKFAITLAMLTEMGGNFDKRVLGQDVFIDVSHRFSDGSAGKVLKLSVDPAGCMPLWSGRTSESRDPGQELHRPERGVPREFQDNER